jgi:HSP20 family protein
METGNMYKSYDDMLDELERQMRRISDDMLMQMFGLPGSLGEVWSPRVDVYETKDNLVIKVCAAGIKPEMVDVSLSSDNRFLTVRGIRREHNVDRRVVIRYYQLEVYYGPFERIVPIPPEVRIDREQLKATYKDGFLIVTLPKTNEAEKMSVEITE